MSVLDTLRERRAGNGVRDPRPPPRKPAGWRTFARALRRIASEPLVHFVAAGLVLFAIGEIYHRQTSLYRIEVTPRHVAQLANDYALQFGARPDPQTLRQIVGRDVHDEMLYRQGLALKLDRDDEIVRRRVIQKMQFLMQDLNPPPEPTAPQLQAFYDAHASRYLTPPRASFTHIYFATDAGEAAARARAAAVLRTLPSGLTRAPERGDPFPDLYDFSAYEPEQVDRLFGRTPLAQAVFQAPVGRWLGPYRSGYGWHLIYIDARQPPTRPPLAAVRDQVRLDYLQAAQAQANAQAFETLARRFTVVGDGRETGR
ncbi:MAG TPA: peptidylprolyl isomerase [Phenylobacterium sp.]|uniref:peptidylprolyl isomerase n=1 Tax=Phenylobacterium sp. TaxID=1871053 RepID=UPI002C1274E2|nr:peptidylprolyl isomerase [Phenylobacterium sp.]HSV01885.1 peptidylprolyl isomerase [Phenylobacterium sp.]